MALLKQVFTLFKLISIFRLVKPDTVKLLSIIPIVYGGFIIRTFFRVPVVFYFTGLGYMFTNQRSSVKHSIFKFFYKFSINNSKSLYIFENHDDLNFINSNFLLNVSKGRLKVIPGAGIDTDVFSPVESFPQPLVVLVSCRLLFDKGLKEFVDAAKIVKEIFPNVVFQIAGAFDPGNPSSIPPATIDAWHKSGVINFLGFQNNILRLVQKSTICVLPSYREGFPKALIEAASCGKPIITTNVPGCRETLIENVTGLLVPVHDHISLSQSIIKLLSNHNLLISMGQNARKFALNNFSKKIIISKNLRVYTNSLDYFNF